MSIHEYGPEYPFYLDRASNYKRPLHWLALFNRALKDVYYPLRLSRGDIVLDAGGNIGDLGHYLGFLGVTTMCIDLNHAALQFGHDTFSFGRNTFFRGRLSHLPFPDKYFDAIASMDVFEHFPDVQYAKKALRELSRVCGGERMVIKVTVLEDTKWIDGDSTHHIKESAEWWSEFFTNNGWRTVCPTTKKILSKNKRTLIGLDKIYGYFLLERSKQASLVK